VTANATPRAIRSLMRKISRDRKLNILTFATHERYEENLCKTGHEFYSLNIGKQWDETYAPVPHNYHIINQLPHYIDFDLVLAHTNDERLHVAHSHLSRTANSSYNRMTIPILRHTHTLPDIRYDTRQQIQSLHDNFVDHSSFISNYSRSAWGFDSKTASVVEHGIDTDFWRPDPQITKNNVCLSVVNDWPNRDWCCGFKLWQETSHGLPVAVVGKCPGFSEPAQSTAHLRQIYQSSRIFYNTSLHSPVPTALMEAMACGCAIVSTATCMIPEIIQHGENGLISNDPEELRQFLEMLLKDEKAAIKMGQNAAKTIKTKYSISNFVDGWNELLYTTIENYKESQ